MFIPDRLSTIIKACQKAAGVKEDGDPWDDTWIAIYKRLTGVDWVPPTLTPPTAEPEPAPSLIIRPTRPLPSSSEEILTDDRSEAAIATLLPEIQPMARALVIEAGLAGIDIKITSGTRSYAEQNALFAQRTDGKDNDQDRRVDEADENVTSARAGFSSHNFGLAFDVTIFAGRNPVWESPRYRQLGAIGKHIGLSWGGDWKKADEPHFYLKPRWAQGASETAFITGLRERKSAGRDLLA